jgi:oxygen-independent coproporphyrinogen III oxidase
MLTRFFTNAARRYLVGPEQEFVFKAVDPVSFVVPQIQKLGIYIHIPFCKTICPFCPYNKIKYDQHITGPYVAAMLQEIDLYAERLGSVEISSIYIGGGTPTTLIDELGVVLGAIKEKCNVVGDICIETTVADITPETLAKLKAHGITALSVGVQSFQDKQLAFLGRNYRASQIYPALALLKTAGFTVVNVDLMFALTGQTVDDVLGDLQQAIDAGVDQITTYPLFTFPYSAIGSYLKLKKLKMPTLRARRKMYKTIHDFLLSKGFERVSVWGFKKGAVPRYSSVTRDYYIGLGAGAASSFPEQFYFNTFSVPAYIERLKHARLPVAFSMAIMPALSQVYWFYWRLYDTHLSLAQVRAVCGQKSKAERLLKLFCFLGLCTQTDGNFSLTERGSFWIHLMQNYFVLNYINRVWTTAMKNPWPERIEL